MVQKLRRLSATADRDENAVLTEWRGKVRQSLDEGIDTLGQVTSHSDTAIGNLSILGCQIPVTPAPIRKGQFVSIRSAGPSILPGIVRWIRNGSAGVELLGTVGPEVVEELRRSNRPLDVRQL